MNRRRDIGYTLKELIVKIGIMFFAISITTITVIGGEFYCRICKNKILKDDVHGIRLLLKICKQEYTKRI